MLEIVIILAVAYIVIPLFELVLAERVLFIAKVTLYSVLSIWLVYAIYHSGRV